MTLLSLVLMNIGCEDTIDNPAVNPSEGKTVEVALSIGIANEEEELEAGTSPVSKAGNSNNGRSAFEVVPVSGVQTKAATDCPDQLYNLEIWQYDRSGNKISSSNYGQVLGAKAAIGSSFTATLTEAKNCQLLLIARGATADFESLSGKTLSAVQDMKVKVETSKINAIATNATGSSLANMPYYLLLKDVNVTSDGKIQSPDGKDVRLLLKRLAVKVRLDWTFAQEMTDKGYTLKEVKLCQVPAHYRLIPKTESTDKWGEVYPNSVVEFVDVYRLKETELTGSNNSKTVWIPANARGISSYATSPYYRNKTNANAAATYAEFVVDNSGKKERLYYRAYLGGNETNDFNLLENKNYHWTVNINNANYTNDPRIQLLDQTPVESTNLQPTSNCFMMRPGTNICFNPYKHEAGTDGWNTELTTGGSAIQSEKTIDHVEVLWQTKDAGTSGDLVMGYVIDDNNHENLVNLTNGDDINNARVHVKVPVTNGGNAVIAAKNSSGTIVWSWHLWITDYVPQGITSSINYEQAQKNTSNGSVHRYNTSPFTNGIYKEKVMMDRNLCATAGGFPGQDASDLDFGKRIGYLYCWGRKDPFFGSVDGTNNEINVIYNSDGESIGLDFVPYSKTEKINGNTLQWTIQHPLSFIKGENGNGSWYSSSEDGSYNNLYDNGGKKTLYDPCPDGWTIPAKDAFNGISTSNAYWYNPNGIFVQNGTAHNKGGRLYNTSGNSGTPIVQTIHNTAWFPVTSYRGVWSGQLTVSSSGLIGTRSIGKTSDGYRAYFIKLTCDRWDIGNAYGPIGEPNTQRCVQE